MCASSEPRAEATVVLTDDLHARPAGQLSKLAATHQSRIVLEVDGRSADTRSVLAIMSLGATTGQQVTIRADGTDAVQAVAAVVAALADAAPVRSG
jgi:phosphotransferase system HPr (HPr) family protein